jgi:hypothetical protein
VLLEELEEHHAHRRFRAGLLGRVLVGLQDDLRPEGVVVGIQSRVVEQHAHALVDRREPLFALALELGGRGVEFERLVEVVFADERELAQADVGEARRDLLRLVRRLAEFGLVFLAELLLDHRALRLDDGLRFEHELAQLRVVRLLDHFLGGSLRLVEHPARAAHRPSHRRSRLWA